MSIELEVAALYLPVGDAQLVFELFAVAAATSATHEPAARVVLDDAAWQLAVRGVAPAGDLRRRRLADGASVRPSGGEVAVAPARL